VILDERQWLFTTAAEVIPEDPIGSPVEWGRKHVRLIGSAKAEAYNPEITPWTKQPIEWCDDGITRIVTYVKPIQAGGSGAGEIILCRWVSTKHSGDIQYNWEDDIKADERWEKRIEKILRACEPVMKRWPKEREKAKKGLVIFPHCNLTVQGVFTDSNLDSDSIRFQINEEIHNWEPGRLKKAYGRTTAFWDSVIFNISNASEKGDQLHLALINGTHQHWEVKCPGCGFYHVMRTRWDDKRPDLGGLRYDSDGCKRPDGTYNYNKMESTIRFQMPCGYPVRDTEDMAERRQLADSGRYGEPTNDGAHISHRSATLEAVSVYYIPFIKLIQEKHEALRAMYSGDPEPWKRYLQERECQFWDPEERPLAGKVVINTAIKKDREGLRKNPLFYSRLFALDRQQGTLAKGELPHWWLVIRDVLTNGDSLLVFEGKVETDENVIEILDRHECLRFSGVADSGDDTTHVYQFCLKYGIHAIKGGKEAFYAHPDKSKKIYSVERPLHAMLNAPSKYEYTWQEVPEYSSDGTAIPVAKLAPVKEEPMFWLYSKAGIRDRLSWLRAGGFVKWEVPGDVSNDYKKHMEAEELEKQVDATGHITMVWRQYSERNDLFVCECYIAKLMEIAGLIGIGAIEEPTATAAKEYVLDPNKVYEPK
jgi:hypothetical protein